MIYELVCKSPSNVLDLLVVKNLHGNGYKACTAPKWVIPLNFPKRAQGGGGFAVKP